MSWFKLTGNVTTEEMARTLVQFLPRARLYFKRSGPTQTAEPRLVEVMLRDDNHYHCPIRGCDYSDESMKPFISHCCSPSHRPLLKAKNLKKDAWRERNEYFFGGVETEKWGTTDVAPDGISSIKSKTTGRDSVARSARRSQTPSTLPMVNSTTQTIGRISNVCVVWDAATQTVDSGVTTPSISTNHARGRPASPPIRNKASRGSPTWIHLQSVLNQNNKPHSPTQATLRKRTSTSSIGTQAASRTSLGDKDEICDCTSENMEASLRAAYKRRIYEEMMRGLSGGDSITSAFCESVETLREMKDWFETGMQMLREADGGGEKQSGRRGSVEELLDSLVN
ncbi:hypothetical protein BJ508DRAFT_419030 [Ascobolus immersus RN42]|uniref:Uncharacterized protein n=1 Tax=Ascobolus immersus RN42 TaxID=1160509 RepID=A0A3N4HHF1_ASCIM|nr:hypothetical protein BJ508DRAFT_419030 [Ascobolus immersus RN42]